jgi:CRP-like cAMP-binding protein
MALSRLVPGARRSRELPSVSRTAAGDGAPRDSGGAAAYEIPLVSSAGPAAGGDAATSIAETVRSVMPRTPLFSRLDEFRLKLMIERVRLVRLAAGEVAFRQGDKPDALYVVAHGEVAVHVQGAPAAPPVEVARLGEGHFFGEIALVTNQPRNATVVAVTDTELLAVDRLVISALVHSSPYAVQVLLGFLRDRLVDTLVDTSPLFAPFSGDERLELAARFRFLEVEPGAVVIAQGNLSPGLFIVLCGRAQVDVDGTIVAELGAGDLAGELSLLTRGAAVATVRAVSKCFALELPRAEFQRVIMSHPQVLEYVSAVAEERRRLLDELRTRGASAPAGFREGHLPVV